MIDMVTVICYGEEERWASREQAEYFYQRATAGSEGHERQRYVNILNKLQKGMKICSDEES